MATVTVFLECVGGPADSEVVELPWDAAECALGHGVTGARPVRGAGYLGGGSA